MGSGQPDLTAGVCLNPDDGAEETQAAPGLRGCAELHEPLSCRGRPAGHRDAGVLRLGRLATPSGWAPAQPPEPTRPDSPRPAWRGSYRADNPAHTEPLEDSDTRWDSLTLVP